LHDGHAAFVKGELDMHAFGDLFDPSFLSEGDQRSTFSLSDDAMKQVITFHDQTSLFNNSNQQRSLLLNGNSSETTNQRTNLKRRHSMYETLAPSPELAQIMSPPSRRASIQAANPMEEIDMSFFANLHTIDENFFVDAGVQDHKQQTQPNMPIISLPMQPPKANSSLMNFPTYTYMQGTHHSTPHPQHTQSSLAKPIPKPDSDGSKLIYRCSYAKCDKVFDKFQNLKSHVKTHSCERPYVCQTCNMRFSRNHDLKRHERIHSGLRPYNCEYCGKSFLRLDALNRHLKVDNGKGCRSRIKKSELC
jgi:hypothetical protein